MVLHARVGRRLIQRKLSKEGISHRDAEPAEFGMQEKDESIRFFSAGSASPREILRFSLFFVPSWRRREPFFAARSPLAEGDHFFSAARRLESSISSSRAAVRTAASGASSRLGADDSTPCFRRRSRNAINTRLFA